LEFVYNGSWHSYIKTSSLNVLYGWEYLILLFISTLISKIKGVNEMIVNMQYILKLVKKKYAKCLTTNKFYVNKNQSPKEFEVNDKIF
jgi:hypothetical protein